MHFLALRGINRTVWGTKLLQTGVLAHPVDYISSCQIMKAWHCCLSQIGCFNPPLPPHPPWLPPTPPSHPPPIDSIHDITGTEKLSEKPAVFWN